MIVIVRPHSAVYEANSAWVRKGHRYSHYRNVVFLIENIVP